MIPTPARVALGRRHWFVWFLIPAADGRRFTLTLVAR